MTQQTINVGSAANDGTGDPARTAFTKSNDNFTELYATRQPLDAELTALASVTSGADLVPIFTGSGTASTTQVTPAARTVLDDTTTAAMLTTLGAAPAANFPSGAWTAWTPTFTAGGGTIGAISVNVARYIQLGKTVFVQLDFQVTNAGTGAGVIFFTLPVAVSAGGVGAVFGRERALMGYLLGGGIHPAAAQGIIARYDGGSPIVLNHVLTVAGFYEVA